MGATHVGDTALALLQLFVRIQEGRTQRLQETVTALNLQHMYVTGMRICRLSVHDETSRAHTHGSRSAQRTQFSTLVEPLICFLHFPHEKKYVLL